MKKKLIEGIKIKLKYGIQKKLKPTNPVPLVV